MQQKTKYIFFGGAEPKSSSPSSQVIFESVATEETSRKLLDYVARFFVEQFVIPKTGNFLPSIGQVLRAKMDSTWLFRTDGKGSTIPLPSILCHQE